jgi:hypothetical protein
MELSVVWEYSFQQTGHSDGAGCGLGIVNSTNRALRKSYVCI